MAFDPNLPPDGAFATAAALRAQLNGLKALIDAVPAGPPGPVGPAFSHVQIGGVTTVEPGTAAAAWVSVSGNTVELSFSIPKGEPGSSGVSSSDVTNAIAAEISGTARNSSAVAQLAISVSNPPTQAELETVISKLNELIAALAR